MSFYKYGSHGSISLWDLIAEARRDGMLHAEAEYSGSEGCYTEVAYWNDEVGRYERYCFKKWFASDHFTDWERAKVIADAINEASGCRHAPWIHTLPDRGSNHELEAVAT